jgi:CRISPR/Cas system-associated exonuclease Cas4 (RecB family)
MIDFDVLIDRHIARESRPKSIGRYYPSEIGNCIRKVWYTYNYPLEVEPRLRRIFHLGGILHDFVVEVLKSDKNKEVKLLKSEMPFKVDMKDFIISGRIDDLLLLKSDNSRMLVEVKSCKSIRGIKRPLAHHKTQLQFYMYATHVHKGVLLYIDKSTLETKCFEVKFSAKRGRQILNKFRALHKHLTKETLPAAEAKRSDGMAWMCKYCEYSDKCKKDDK